MEHDQASKFVNDLLRLMLARNGSDLFLTADFPPPAIKVDGKVTKDAQPAPLFGYGRMAPYIQVGRQDRARYALDQLWSGRSR